MKFLTTLMLVLSFMVFTSCAHKGHHHGHEGKHAEKSCCKSEKDGKKQCTMKDCKKEKCDGKSCEL